MTGEPPAICGPINATAGDMCEGDTLAVYQQTTQHHTHTHTLLDTLLNVKSDHTYTLTHTRDKFNNGIHPAGI